MEGGTGRPYAPFGALRPLCDTPMSKQKHTSTTYPHSLLLEGGTGRPYAPFGALRPLCNTLMMNFESHDHSRNHSAQEGLEPTPAPPPYFSDQKL